MTLIGDFMTKTEGYRARLCGRTSGNAVSNSWQKVGWALFKKEELKDLKDRLHVKLSNISLLLQTAKLYDYVILGRFDMTTDKIRSYERAPSLVAKYEEPSPPPSYSHLASEAELSGTPSVPANVTLAQDPQEETLSNIEARFARLEEILNEQRTKEVARATVEEARPQEAAVTQPNIQETSIDLGSVREPDNNKVVTNTNNNDMALALSTGFNQQPKIELAKFSEVKGDEPKEDTKIQQESEIDVDVFREPESDDAVSNRNVIAKTEMQLSTKARKPLESRRTDDTDTSGLISALEQALCKFKLATDPNDKKKPIKFKDAVGRKFSFPFRLCTTWAVSLALVILS